MTKHIVLTDQLIEEMAREASRQTGVSPEGAKRVIESTEPETLMLRGVVASLKEATAPVK